MTQDQDPDALLEIDNSGNLVGNHADTVQKLHLARTAERGIEVSEITEDTSFFDDLVGDTPKGKRNKRFLEESIGLEKVRQVNSIDELVLLVGAESPKPLTDADKIKLAAYFSGYSYPEIAGLFETSNAAIQVRISNIKTAIVREKTVAQEVSPISDSEEQMLEDNIPQDSDEVQKSVTRRGRAIDRIDFDLKDEGEYASADKRLAVFSGLLRSAESSKTFVKWTAEEIVQILTDRFPGLMDETTRTVLSHYLTGKPLLSATDEGVKFSSKTVYYRLTQIKRAIQTGQDIKRRNKSSEKVKPAPRNTDVKIRPQSVHSEVTFQDEQYLAQPENEEPLDYDAISRAIGETLKLPQEYERDLRKFLEPYEGASSVVSLKAKQALEVLRRYLHEKHESLTAEGLGLTTQEASVVRQVFGIQNLSQQVRSPKTVFDMIHPVSGTDYRRAEWLQDGFTKVARSL